MNPRSLAFIVIALTLTLSSLAQEPGVPPDPQGQGPRGGGPGGGRGWGMGGGRGIAGTIIEAAADHYAVKTESGDIYTIHFSANTRILKQQPRPKGENAGQAQQGGRAEGGFERGGNPPSPIKPSDIKVGDAVVAMGEIDANAKSVGAVMVMQIDPERAKQMREMEANYGKTWLMGQVTAIDGVRVTLTGGPDRAEHSFVADENTTFRKRREPITLADIQVGDMVRAEGAVKGGSFIATAVNAGGPPQGGPGNGPPSGPPNE